MEIDKHRKLLDLKRSEICYPGTRGQSLGKPKERIALALRQPKGDIVLGKVSGFVYQQVVFQGV